MGKYIMALDQGTTSSRTILFDENGSVQSMRQQAFEQLFPKPGWVEHDPEVIWNSQLETIKEVLSNGKVSRSDIAAIGITNQRETTLVWERATGRPVYNAIVWQDRRTAKHCDALRSQGHAEMIREKTGLVLDAYFSATKVQWILDTVEGARQKAEAGELCFGTVDAWLIWKLTEGKHHVTDVTNASRTMLFNIHSMEWDAELLSLFNIPKAMLPAVKSCSEVFGSCSIDPLTGIPISGVAGDQQAALFGQMCVNKGMVKNTYGTGCFLIMNTGHVPVSSKSNLLTTVAWKFGEKVTYGLEGSVFVGGAAVQWIRDGLQLVESAEAIEALAASEEDNGGVYFVPALTGLGAPHWDPEARGAIFGLTRGSTQGHIARATLEGIAFQVYEVIKAMENDLGEPCNELRVDGGAAANALLLQFQSDLGRNKVIRPKTLETTALGAAYFAGLAVGFWDSVETLQEQWKEERLFEPKMEMAKAEEELANWRKAVSRSKAWSS